MGGYLGVAVAALGLVASACTLKVPGNSVRIKIELPKETRDFAFGRQAEPMLFAGTVPALITGMDCFFLNVNGPGIDADNSGSGRELSFLDLGITSRLASQTDGYVSMRVPSGLARTIQVLGVASSPSAAGRCANEEATNYLLTERPSLFEVGRSTAALFQDSTVTVSNAYDSRFAYDMMSGYEGVLLLAQGYSGDNPLGGINTLAGGLPPAGMTDVTGSALSDEFAILQNPAESAALLHQVSPPGMGALYARMDFAFSLGSINLSRYSTIRVEGNVGGGNSAFAGTCSTNITATSRVDLAIYDARNAGWSTTTSATTPTADALTPLELPFSSDYIESYGGQSFIHVALLSTDPATAGACSNILVDKLKVTLVE